MDKVLKRRLVGATILIALAVIFIPMLLEDPGTEYGERQLAIDLPRSSDADREIRRLPLDPDAARRLVTPPADVEEATRQIQPEPDAVLREDEEPPESEPSEAVTPAPGPEQDKSAAAGNWVVQVASFGSAATAEQIAEQLEQLGHPALLDTVVRGESMLYRVRTGPYPDASTAETARAQIGRTVTGVEPEAIHLGDWTIGNDRAGYAVQVGSFASRDNAIRLSEQLADQGFEAFLYEEQSGGRPIWRVRVGPEPERSMAEEMLARLRQEARLEGIVVSHP